MYCLFFWGGGEGSPPAPASYGVRKQRDPKNPNTFFLGKREQTGAKSKPRKKGAKQTKGGQTHTALERSKRGPPQKNHQHKCVVVVCLSPPSRAHKGGPAAFFGGECWTSSSSNKAPPHEGQRGSPQNNTGVTHTRVCVHAYARAHCCCAAQQHTCRLIIKPPPSKQHQQHGKGLAANNLFCVCFCSSVGAARTCRLSAWAPPSRKGPRSFCRVLLAQARAPHSAAKAQTNDTTRAGN